METKKALPTLATIYEDNIEVAFKKDQMNLILNSKPKQEWIKTNQYANNSLYIPIGIVETLLQKLFKEFKVEILREGTMYNSVYATVRLHYKSFIDNQWMYHDGTGASELQCKKDTGVLKPDFSNINKGAVEMSLPKAVSAAIKDAAEHIGVLFGRDLNRKDVLQFEADRSISIDAVNDKKEKARIIDFILNAKDKESMGEILESIERYDLMDVYNAKLKSLI